MTLPHSHKDKQPVRRTTFWYNQKFFKYLVETLLVLTIILVFSKAAIVLNPVLDFVYILATPLILAVLFYYLLRPIVHFLEGYHVPRFVSIMLIYGVMAFLLAVLLIYMGPIVMEQISALANNSVETLEKIKGTSSSIFTRFLNINIDQEIETRVFSLIQQGTSILSKNLVDIFGILTRVATILAVIPFIVFYLLKDDQEIIYTIIKSTSIEMGKELLKILHNVDNTLSGYIRGLAVVSSSVGIMLFIGYWIIGLNYALILSLIALIFTTIPFVGPFLAVAPAILVGLTDSPFMVVKVISVFLVVQQTESNIISPQIIGHRLHIHPLTLILLLLAAGSLYGLLGLILATPLYAVTKVLAISLYKIYQLRSSRWRQTLSAPAEK